MRSGFFAATICMVLWSFSGFDCGHAALTLTRFTFAQNGTFNREAGRFYLRDHRTDHFLIDVELFEQFLTAAVRPITAVVANALDQTRRATNIQCLNQTTMSFQKIFRAAILCASGVLGFAIPEVSPKVACLVPQSHSRDFRPRSGQEVKRNFVIRNAEFRNPAVGQELL